MDATLVVIILAAAGAAVLVVAALAIWLHRRRRHRRELKVIFGSEYDRAVAKANGRGDAEAVLDARRERVESYELRALTPAEQGRFDEQWHTVQSEFVDQPSRAVAHADELLTALMLARGYPEAGATSGQLAADISVGHGDEAESYREARRIAARNRDGQATTEDLRRAMQHYRRAFEALLAETPTEASV